MGKLAKAVGASSPISTHQIYIAPHCIRYTNSTLDDTIYRIDDESLNEIAAEILESNNTPPKLQIVFYNNRYFAINNSHLQIYKQLQLSGLITHVQADLINIEAIPYALRQHLLQAPINSINSDHISDEDELADELDNLNQSNGIANILSASNVEMLEKNVLVDETYEFGTSENCVESEEEEEEEQTEEIHRNRVEPQEEDNACDEDENDYGDEDDVNDDDDDDDDDNDDDDDGERNYRSKESLSKEEEEYEEEILNGKESDNNDYDDYNEYSTDENENSEQEVEQNGTNGNENEDKNKKCLHQIGSFDSNALKKREKQSSQKFTNRVNGFSTNQLNLSKKIFNQKKNSAPINRTNFEKKQVIQVQTVASNNKPYAKPNQTPPIIKSIDIEECILSNSSTSGELNSNLKNLYIQQQHLESISNFDPEEEENLDGD
jgi:hypothetical protein